ncbi:MAG TPA: hypothetical protein VHZ03_39610 [Trebonia sp.]|jgi:hypothetical protein|nr:hypothetical protein [Trebonia sp.]
MKTRRGLAAFGVIAALAVAGCGQSGSAGSAASSGAAGSSTLPSWAAALGTGVTLEAPTKNPAAGSPQATVKAYVAALTSGANPASACAYLIPSSQSSCQNSISTTAQQGQEITYSYRSFGLGYTAIHGSQALVGSTYAQFCVQAASRNCAPDITDPKTVFESGISFATLWTQTQQQNSGSSSFSPVPCIVLNGKWYVDAPSS